MSYRVNKLVAVTPVFNEERYIMQWLEHVAVFCDHIVISDGGSTDGTLRAIEEFVAFQAQSAQTAPSNLRVASVTLIDHSDLQGEPYRGFNEGAVRNRLMAELDSEDWALVLDVDEMLDDLCVAEMDDLLRYLEARRAVSCTFKLVAFWGSMKEFRVNDPLDPRWDVGVCRMLRGSVRYNEEVNHAIPVLTSAHPRQRAVRHDYQCFHLHYAEGPLKPGDNRRNDVGVDGGIIDWHKYCTQDHPEGYRVRLQSLHRSRYILPSVLQEESWF